MTEIERHPYLVRQGAAAIAVVVATAAAVPALATRAEAQREASDWALRAMAFHDHLRAPAALSAPRSDIELRVQAASFGWRAEGATTLGDGALEAPALFIEPNAPRVQLASLSASDANGMGRIGRQALAAREDLCLAQAIYYEARGESRSGQLAVAEVVMNRVRSGIYPNTICGVVYQGSERTTGCQFSFTCDGSMGHRPRGAAWRQAKAIAAQVQLAGTGGVTNRATHYHTVAVDPYWNDTLVETARIGAHIFYRFPNRSERALLAASARAPQPEARDLDGAADPVLAIGGVVASVDDLSPDVRPGDVLVTPKTAHPAAVAADAPALPLPSETEEFGA